MSIIGFAQTLKLPRRQAQQHRASMELSFPDSNIALPIGRIDVETVGASAMYPAAILKPEDAHTRRPQQRHRKQNPFESRFDHEIDDGHPAMGAALTIRR
jgi:hypothetical protein